MKKFYVICINNELSDNLLVLNKKYKALKQDYHLDGYSLILCIYDNNDNYISSFYKYRFKELIDFRKERLKEIC